MVLGNEDKRWNIITRVISMSLIAQEIPSFGEDVSQELWTRTKIAFIINHNITTSKSKLAGNCKILVKWKKKSLFMGLQPLRLFKKQN